MAKKVILSKQWALNWFDVNKSLIMAIGTPLLYMLQEMIPGWDAPLQLKVAISALLMYLIKNFSSPATVSTTYASNVEAEVVAAKVEGGQ